MVLYNVYKLFHIWSFNTVCRYCEVTNLYRLPGVLGEGVVRGVEWAPHWRKY